MNDLPTFTSSNLATSTSNVGQLMGRSNLLTNGTTTISIQPNALVWDQTDFYDKQAAKSHLAQYLGAQTVSTPVAIKSKLRIVRVFLVDPDERVPVAKRILYRSEELTTDATDQELYFDIPVNDLLKAHNAERAKVEWEEKTSEGTKTRVGLKEVRIRDLVMSVTTIAEFAGR